MKTTMWKMKETMKDLFVLMNLQQHQDGTQFHLISVVLQQTQKPGSDIIYMDIFVLISTA